MQNHSILTSPHERIRRDHSLETAEDYVEAVAEIASQGKSCRVVDLAKKFAVSHVTVTRIVARLQQQDLVTTQPYRPVELTAKGKRLAKRCKHRHEVVFQFLVALGVDEKNATVDAEGIEHHVGRETLRVMQRFLADPKLPVAKE